MAFACEILNVDDFYSMQIMAFFLQNLVLKIILCDNQSMNITLLNENWLCSKK